MLPLCVKVTGTKRSKLDDCLAITYLFGTNFTRFGRLKPERSSESLANS